MYVHDYIIVNCLMVVHTSCMDQLTATLLQLGILHNSNNLLILITMHSYVEVVNIFRQPS